MTLLLRWALSSMFWSSSCNLLLFSSSIWLWKKKKWNQNIPSSHVVCKTASNSGNAMAHSLAPAQNYSKFNEWVIFESFSSHFRVIFCCWMDGWTMNLCGDVISFFIGEPLEEMLDLEVLLADQGDGFQFRLGRLPLVLLLRIRRRSHRLRQRSFQRCNISKQNSYYYYWFFFSIYQGAIDKLFNNNWFNIELNHW